MGVARLLAKVWIVLCLFAGAHALTQMMGAGEEPLDAFAHTGVSTLLFLAMGLLFITGYGASRPGVTRHLKAEHLLPHFTDSIFLLFAVLSFVNQIWIAPHFATGPLSDQIENALGFAVPGQRALTHALVPCSLDGGRIFASATAWILAFVLFGSSLSRLRLAAGILRIERNRSPEPLGAGTVALLFGALAVVGIQLLFVGTAFQFTPCVIYTTVPGEVLIGLGPLMLAYVILAALTSLLATGSE
jgi:hypothetical protein